MNAYEYTAITTDKKRIQGLLWADSEDEVSTKLKLEGYVICSIARSSSKSVRWNHKQVSTTAYQLGLLLQSGISLRRSLELLMDGSKTMLYRLSSTLGTRSYCKNRFVISSKAMASIKRKPT